MNATPKDLEEFKSLEQSDKCTWMYLTMMNHLGSLKEIKWMVRGLLATILGVLLKTIFF